MTIDLVLAHCRNHFLREFAVYEPSKDRTIRQRRAPLRNENNILTITKTYSNRDNQYVSVFAFSKVYAENVYKINPKTKEMKIDKHKGSVIYESAKINRIYIDFDNEENPQESISEALMFMKYLIHRKIFVHCYFSGNRGIAMYIEFKTIQIADENKKAVLEFFIEAVKKGVESMFNVSLKTLDIGMSSDLARVSRIPNTRHKKTGLYCIPLSFGDVRKGIDHIKHLAKEPSNCNLERRIGYVLMRNETMPLLFKSIEKYVIEQRIINARTRPLLKPRAVNTTYRGYVSRKDIEIASNVPISKIYTFQNDRAPCPLHKGDNPTSFRYYSISNTFHCFSCEAHGGVIKFVKMYKNMDFVEAVKYLVSIS